MTFKFLRINFEGDPNVGLYGFATDTYCLLGMELSRKISHKIKEILKTDLTVSTMSGIEFAGLFSSGNSKGLIVSKVAEDFELKKLKELGINIKVINSRETALGNLILCNDKGCLISGLLKRYKKEITDTLDCEVEIGKIADMEIVGSCAVTSNVGCLCHREASEEEMKIIEDVLKVKVDVGSVSYGSPFIKSGIIVNSKGVVFSEQTSGAEMGRIEEVLKNE
jgi:translation initiation factor 6